LIHDNGCIEFLSNDTAPSARIHIKLSDLLEEIIQQYKLRHKVNKQGMTFVKVTKGMYGLPQSGLLANELIEKCLNQRGYYQSKFVPGLWRHKSQPT
jgi:hypothetical protein